MFGINIFVGRLTADPELKQTTTNVPVASFSVAVDPWFVPKGKEKKTEFPNFVAWRQNAEFICRYAKKGSFLFIVSRYTTRDYTGKDKQGNPVQRRVYEFVVEHVKIIGGRSNNDSSADHDNATSQFAPPQNTVPSQYQSGAAGGFPEADDDDGDLPF